MIKILFYLLNRGATTPGAATTAAVTVATGAATSTIALTATADSSGTQLLSQCRPTAVNGKAAARNGSGLVLQETGFSTDSDKPADENKVRNVVYSMLDVSTNPIKPF